MIEGDLSSYFDTVHHRLRMKAVRRRISDVRFMALLWETIKAGHIDVGLFRAASEGVPQGGVICYQRCKTGSSATWVGENQ